MLYKKGFTLIELLIAITILAIVAVLGFRGLDNIVRARTSLDKELEKMRSLQLTFAQLQTDCLQNANQATYPGLPEGRSIWIEPLQLMIIRNVYSEKEAPALSVVVYRLHDNQLTRYESLPTRELNVLADMVVQQKNASRVEDEVVMLKNVSNLTFLGYPEEFITANQQPSVSMKGVSKPQETSQSQDRFSKEATGLQVSLQLIQSEKDITKIFILGGM